MRQSQVLLFRVIHLKMLLSGKYSPLLSSPSCFLHISIRLLMVISAELMGAVFQLCDPLSPPPKAPGEQPMLSLPRDKPALLCSSSWLLWIPMACLSHQ